MVDIVQKTVRSKMMAAIKGRDTKPEMMVRKFLHHEGFRYRTHVRSLPGSPDLVFRKYNLAIFVHGCFWHQHESCRFAAKPDSKSWEEKLIATVERDFKNISLLRHDGWRVFVIWECGLTKGHPIEDLSWLPNAIKDTQKEFVNWPSAPGQCGSK